MPHDHNGVGWKDEGETQNTCPTMAMAHPLPRLAAQLPLCALVSCTGDFPGTVIAHVS